jgi:hypothetical protein
MAQVVSAVELDRIQQGITGDRQRHPPASQLVLVLVLVVVVDRCQTSGVQLAQGGRHGGRTDQAAASRGEPGGELVDALRPAVAQDQQYAPGRRSQRDRRVGQLGRPQLIKGNRQLLFGGMGRLSENSVVVTKNKSYSVTAQLVVPDAGAQGVIVAQGGAYGGWSLYAKDGRPAYCYNLFGLQRFKVHAEEPVPAGEHQVRMEFAYDGGGLAKGGTVSLYVDGAKAGEGRVEGTVPMLFSADETTDVGSDGGTPGQRRLRPQGQPLQRPGAVGPDRP